MRKIAPMMLLAASIGAPATAQTTVQQDFDTATALYDKGDFAGALAKWQALEVRTTGKPRSHALVLVREGRTLLALDRKDEAVAATNAGLAALPASDATLRGDRFMAYVVLGQVGEAALDYGSALAAFRQAEGLAADPAEKLMALRGVIQTATFVDPPEAEQGLARAAALTANVKTDAGIQAMIKRLQGQLLLNQGVFEASRLASGDAVKLLGGLTTQTNLDDVAVRSNYAIAALLGGKKDDARRYMAMTGAGRLNKGSFDPGAGMKVPDCAGDTGLKPADMAVIEFSINDDGVVWHSEPIYAAGGGRVALEFARAVRNWSWTTEQTKQMPAFFRHRVRVELRCSTAFERPSIDAFLDGELSAWLADRNVVTSGPPSGSDAEALPRLRAQLTTAEAAQRGEVLALVPILHQLVRNAVIPNDDRVSFARREMAILTSNKAPPTVLLAIAPAVWVKSIERWKEDSYAKAIAPALSMEAYANDPVARSALRLILADGSRKDDKKARALLTAIGEDSALPANHSLRVGALVRLASLEKTVGNEAAAAAAFEKSGLSAQQCALIDSAPRFLGTKTKQFPAEAQQWGFEGWTTAQYDISAKGEVVNQRIVAAYPPFVFSEAGGKIIKSGRFAKSFRPDGALGCGGSTQRVHFRLP